MEITDVTQHDHQVNVIYTAGNDEYVWPAKGDEIYCAKENTIHKVEPPVPTRNGLCDHFMIPK